VWIGERTRQLDGAHIAFAELLANPIGLKIGPTHDARAGRRVRRAARPRQPPGRLTLVSRMGNGGCATCCPRSSRRSRPPATRSSGSATRCTATPSSRDAATRPATSTGSSTRCRASSRCTARSARTPAGIHVEVTGEDVTECLGGAQEISDADLPGRYETACDPRLNTQQALELAFLVAEMLRG
jgi:3-deoxy-7-phosphoheptulonate synthase